MPEDRDSEIKQYLEQTATLVMETATSGGAVHTSQSFGGYRQSSAIVVCLVACPESAVLEVQEAIDRAVLGVLDKPPLGQVKVQ